MHISTMLKGQIGVTMLEIVTGQITEKEAIAEALEALAAAVRGQTTNAKP